MSLMSHPFVAEIDPTHPRAAGGGHGDGTCAVVWLEPEQWDRTVSAFDGIYQEQLFTYAHARWPGLEIEPVLMSDANGPVGGALVMLQRLPLGLATIALVKWGPFLADSARPDALERMGDMVDALVTEYADKRGMMVSIMPRAEPGETNRVAGLLASKGFSAGVGLRNPGRYVVEVGKDDEARMAGFAQKWRYHLRKSFKAGLDFEVGIPGDLDRFMTLYRAMSARKLFPDYSAIDGLDALLAMPDGTARPEIFFVTKGGETVAGAVIFTAGDTATYLYGATNDAALDLRAGYFLHWNIIRWLRDNTRAAHYDLGGTDGFQGLHQFKSGMVGEAGYISDIPPVYNIARRPHIRLLCTLAYEVRERVNRLRTLVLSARLWLARRMRKA